MNILSTQFTLKFRSLDIYVAGCKGNPHCPNCHNPESWNFNCGEEYNSKYYLKILKKVYKFNDLIERIMIFGGEPLDQDHVDLEGLLFDLTGMDKEIWLFTRYELNEIPENIKSKCDYIKCGRYIEELKTDNNNQYNIDLATSNQNIYKKDKDY